MQAVHAEFPTFGVFHADLPTLGGRPAPTLRFTPGYAESPTPGQLTHAERPTHFLYRDYTSCLYLRKVGTSAQGNRWSASAKRSVHRLWRTSAHAMVVAPRDALSAMCRRFFHWWTTVHGSDPPNCAESDADGEGAREVAKPITSARQHVSHAPTSNKACRPQSKALTDG